MRRVRHQQVHVVVLPVRLHQVGAEVRAHAGEHLAKGVRCSPGSTPRRTFVTKTKCTLSAETACLPRR